MKYLRVDWLNAPAKMPIRIYSELDDERWEVRKVEVFTDGTGCADRYKSTRDTFLSIEPLPSLEEISAQREFMAVEISPTEFENIWREACSAEN